MSQQIDFIKSAEEMYKKFPLLKVKEDTAQTISCALKGRFNQISLLAF